MGRKYVRGHPDSSVQGFIGFLVEACKRLHDPKGTGLKELWWLFKLENLCDCQQNRSCKPCYCLASSATQSRKQKQHHGHCKRKEHAGKEASLNPERVFKKSLLHWEKTLRESEAAEKQLVFLPAPCSSPQISTAQLAQTWQLVGLLLTTAREHLHSAFLSEAPVAGSE